MRRTHSLSSAEVEYSSGERWRRRATCSKVLSPCGGTKITNTCPYTSSNSGGYKVDVKLFDPEKKPPASATLAY